MKTWKNTLKNTEMGLMHQLKEKDKAINSQLHKEFFTHITKSLDDFFEITDIRDLVQFFAEKENKLFNRRITKFVKVPEQHKLQDLRNHMLITVSYILFIYRTQRNYSILHLEKNDQLNNQRQL